jgi:hypothetical protein
MQCSTGTNAVVTSYNQGTSSQKYTFAAPSWVRGVGQKLSAALGRSDGTTQGLPQHTRTSPTISVCTPGGSNLVQSQSLHLMGCMQHDQDHQILYQDRVDHITTDRDFFSFMKNQLAQRRGHIRKLFTCTCIQGIRLVKVRSSYHNTVEISTDLASSSTSGPTATLRSATTSHFAYHRRLRTATVFHRRTGLKEGRTLNIGANPSLPRILALHSHPPT